MKYNYTNFKNYGLYDLHLKIGDMDKRMRYVVSEITSKSLRAFPFDMIKNAGDIEESVFSLKIPYSFIIGANESPINDVYFYVGTKNRKLKEIVEKILKNEKRSRENKELVCK